MIGLILLVMVSAVRCEKAARPSAELQAEHAAKLTANRVIGQAVNDYLNENEYCYSDFAAVLCDETGRPAAVEALTFNINRIQSDLTVLINDRLADERNATAEIAAGTLTGSYLLTGRGPRVKVRVCPTGEATVELKSEFDSAGINQTRHRIYAVIAADLVSSVPFFSFETNEEFRFLIAETVIVGEVPDIAPYSAVSNR